MNTIVEDLALMVAGIIVGSLLCQPAAAQHIYNTPPDGNGTAFIEIDGPIEADAYRRFENEIAARLPGGQGPAKSVVIRLSSPGGLIGPAIAIGTMIHAYHWATHVDDGAPCASACALIWLAGTPRSMTLGRVGFHAVYEKDTMAVSSSGNAVVGAYLANLGFGYNAVQCVTRAAPSSIEWVTSESARRCGISFEIRPPTPIPHQPDPAICRGHLRLEPKNNRAWVGLEDNDHPDDGCWFAISDAFAKRVIDVCGAASCQIGGTITDHYLLTHMIYVKKGAE